MSLAPLLVENFLTLCEVALLDISSCKIKSNHNLHTCSSGGSDLVPKVLFLGLIFSDEIESDTDVVACQAASLSFLFRSYNKFSVSKNKMKISIQSTAVFQMWFAKIIADPTPLKRNLDLEIYFFK